MIQYIARSIKSLLVLFLKDINFVEVCICFAVVIGILLIICIRRNLPFTRNRTLYLLILAAYCTFIIAVTLLGRKAATVSAITKGQISLTVLNSNPEHYLDMAYNMLLFMPLGFLLPFLFERNFLNAFLCGAFTSIVIEIVQTVSGKGLFELSDIVGNCIGGILGILAFYLFDTLFRNHKRSQ